MKWLQSVFANADGTGSSRRVFGALLVIACVIAMFMNKSETVILSLLGTGTLLLGLTTIK